MYSIVAWVPCMPSGTVDVFGLGMNESHMVSIRFLGQLLYGMRYKLFTVFCSKNKNLKNSSEWNFGPFALLL
jgi:hypothetical protein